MSARVTSAATAVTVAVLWLAACTAGQQPVPTPAPDGDAAESGSHRVGVMLDLSGPDGVGFELPLAWAVENVNAAGGIAGRDLELVVHDLGEVPLHDAARALVDDPGVVAVVGPGTSRDAMAVADLFTQAGKPLVSPAATSGELSRAFADSPYVWRTVESDIAQLRTLLLVAARDGADSVALLSADDPYGATFFDWFGFTATELALEVTGVHRLPAGDCSEHVDEAVADAPDTLVAVITSAHDGACVVERAAAVSPGTEVLLTDAAESDAFAAALGPAGDGLRGTGLAPDADNGFADAFADRFDREPAPYAANVYDAVLLLAYGLAASDGTAGADLTAGMQATVDGRDGQEVGWDIDGISAAVAALEAGQPVDVSGATGPLEFDADTYTDLVSSTYRLWELDGGEFRAVEYLTTGEAPTATDQRAAYRAIASDRAGGHRVGDAHREVADRTGVWALLVAASSGWDNYRHQADVYAQYRALRDHGIPEDRIVVVSADDVADHPNNPEPGTVRYEVDGPDIRAGVTVDYDPRDLTADDLMAILAGDADDRLPTVVDAGPGDDVYVFLVGHGNADGLFVGASQPVPGPSDGHTTLSPGLLADTLQAMSAAGGYRRMLIAVDACHGGALGEPLDAPGALVVAGANPHENSLSARWDPTKQAWLADEFASGVHQVIVDHPDWTLETAVEGLYRYVAGSHVTAYGPRFGDLSSVPLADFIAP